MTNRSGLERVGRGYPRQPPGPEGVGEEDGAGPGDNPTEAGSSSTAWERMLDALDEQPKSEATGKGLESLRASIAERLHTRGESTLNEDGLSEARVRPARRRRR
jgi:hypothetical protein